MLRKVVIALSCLCVAKAAVFTINAHQDDNDINTIADGEEEQSIKDGAKAMCLGASCFSFCRSMGFKSGYCIGDACHCQGRLAKSGIEESSDSLRSCNLLWCEQNCRRIGFPGGVCVNGRCKCDIRSASSIEKTFIDFDTNFEMNDEVAQSPDVRGTCTAARCNDICRRLGFSGGVCVGPNVCQCRGRVGSSATDELNGEYLSYDINFEMNDEVAQSPDVRGTCTAARCNDICRRLGFSGGVCVGPNVCQCRGRVGSSATDELNGDHFDDGLYNNIEKDVAETPDVRGTCTASRCNNVCRRLGFTGGVCVGPHVCRCRGRNSYSARNVLTEEDYLDIDTNFKFDDEVAQSPDVRGTCTAARCNDICRRLGFSGGVCVGPNVCQCRGRVGSSATDELNRDHFSNEVALIRTIRRCGDVECNRFCIEMGYRRGVCIGTYCQCRMQSAIEKYSIFDVNKDKVESANVPEEESNDIPQS